MKVMQEACNRSGHGLRRFTNYQFGRKLAMNGGAAAIFGGRADTLNENANRTCAHGLHRLAYSSQRRYKELRWIDVIKADERTFLRYLDACLGQGAQRAKGSHIVIGHQRAKCALLL